MMDIKEIKKLSELARINLTNEEEKQFQKEIGAVLGYVDKLQELNLNENGASALEKENATNFRKDENAHEKGVYTEDLLGEVPEKQNGFVKVKQIFS